MSLITTTTRSLEVKETLSEITEMSEFLILTELVKKFRTERDDNSAYTRYHSAEYTEERKVLINKRFVIEILE